MATTERKIAFLGSLFSARGTFFNNKNRNEFSLSITTFNEMAWTWWETKLTWFFNSHFHLVVEHNGPNYLIFQWKSYISFDIKAKYFGTWCSKETRNCCLNEWMNYFRFTRCLLNEILTSWIAGNGPTKASLFLFILLFALTTKRFPSVFHVNVSNVSQVGEI